MPDWHAISHNLHSDLGWNKPINFGYTKAQPLVIAKHAELANLIEHYALAFCIHQTDSGTSDQLNVVLSLLPDSNFFINDQAQWLVPYVPATIRQYPFALIRSTDDRLTVCIDADRNNLSQKDTRGAQAFFDDNAQPSAALNEVIHFLQAAHQNQQLTDHLVGELAKAGLIQPWVINTQRDGKLTNIEGLHRIDEQALRNLPADAVAQLNTMGALEIAYAQLLSEPRIERLKSAIEHGGSPLHNRNAEIDFEFLNKNGTINFSSK